MVALSIGCAELIGFGLTPKKYYAMRHFFLLCAASEKQKKTLYIRNQWYQPTIMNFPWSKPALARDRATADAASSSSKTTTTTNPSVSQQQLGNGTAALVQQQQASAPPQEWAPVAHVGVREDAGALLLLQQQHQQAQLAQQDQASLGQQDQASLGQQERVSSVPVQQQRAPVAQVGFDDDVFDHEVSQLTTSIALEDPFLASHTSRSTTSIIADSQTDDPAF
jgi:hypothetical protein